MSSPVKKLDFTAQQGPIKAKPLVGLPPLNKPVAEVTKETDMVKALNDDEPLLRENPNRFVLFPLKYHEVRDFDASDTRKVFLVPFGN